MRFSVSSFVVAVALACFGSHATAQEQPPAAESPRGEFFSGFIIASTPTEITVNRKGLGKETAAVRTFSIDATTKIEGELKPKAHVTVRFMGDHAVHIIVR